MISFRSYGGKRLKPFGFFCDYYPVKPFSFHGSYIMSWSLPESKKASSFYSSEIGGQMYMF
ncbi:hypothetical protein HOG98_04525 [bacterium]|nr:hypothetical protein [bacterium]